MNSNFKFYAVSDSDGIVSVINDRFESVKAIFHDVSDAKKLQEQALAEKGLTLTVEEVRIIGATNE